jgi:hypothetical protein
MPPAAKGNGFVYNSTQEHITLKNGKPVGHSTHIVIKNNKGTKKCIQYDPDGSRKFITKKLSAKEIGAIKRKEYLPALFKGAMESLRLGRPLSWNCAAAATKKNRRRN